MLQTTLLSLAAAAAVIGLAAPAASAPPLAATPPAASIGDPLVAKALAKVAKVEAAEPGLAKGDAKGAAALIRDLDWAAKRLGAVVQQGTAEWKAAKKRLDDVRAKVVAKRDAKPAPKPSPKPAPKPAPGTGKGGSGGGKTPPPATGGYDFAKLKRLNEDISRDFANLKLLEFKHFLDENRVRGLQKDVAKFRERIAPFPAGDENVKLVTGNIDAFESLVQTGIDRIAADRKTAPAIAARLDTLFDKYDDAKFPMMIQEPFTAPQIRAWAMELQQRRDVKIPGDLAWIKEVSGNVVVGRNRFLSAASNLEVSIMRRVEEAERNVSQIMDSKCKDAVERAAWLMETDPKDRNQVISRVLGKGSFDQQMLFLRDGLHAVEMARIVDEVLKREDAPDRDAQQKALDQGVAHMKALARQTLSEVRMPAPASTDEELLKIARETLKKEKYEVGDWKRLVINSDLRTQERREAWYSRSGARGEINFYTYKWRQFQVTTAEEVDGEVWLFANTLKFYESGDSTTPVGEWILSRRMETTPILAENVDKPAKK